MKIEKDNKGFAKALAAYFPGLDANTLRTVCSVDDDGRILGGWGFTPVKNGKTNCYLISLYKGWASRKMDVEVMRFPFEEMGAEEVTATVGTNAASRNYGVRLGGVNNGRTLTWHKDDVLRLAKEMEGC